MTAASRPDRRWHLRRLTSTSGSSVGAPPTSTPALPDKLALLRPHGIRACLGGTLLEIAWVQGRARSAWTGPPSVGFASVEVSRGSPPMTPGREARADPPGHAARSSCCPRSAARTPTSVLTPQQWAEEVAGDLAAGARWVITEGRESGTVGIYRDDGSIREDVVAAAVRGGGVRPGAVRGSPQGPAGLVHPRVRSRRQPGQHRAVAEVLALETLRLGLRADTCDLTRQWQPA